MRRSYFAALLLSILSAPALGADAPVPDYSCEDPPLRNLKVDTFFLKKFNTFSMEADLQERKKLAKNLDWIARSGAEKAHAKLANALVLRALGSAAEAEPLLVEVLGSAYASRDLVNLARLTLSESALQRGDMDTVLRWLAPMADAGCKNLPSAVRKHLAFAYQEKKEYSKALDQVDRIEFGEGAAGARWRAIQLELRCQVEGDRTCLDQIRRSAGYGQLSGEALSQARRELDRIGSGPEGEALLAEARAAGWLGPDGSIRVSVLEELVLLKAAAASYPMQAIGINGYVDVYLTVNPDGTVKDVEVAEARPPGHFEKVALEAARSSIFKPRMLDGQAVEAKGVRRYVFMMRE